MLPPARVRDRGTPPDAPGPREVEHAARPEAGAILDEMVAVQHERLDARQQALVTIEMCPACLHHPDARVAKVARDRAKKIRLRNEVGIEDGDQLPLGSLEAVLERPCLVPRTAAAPKVDRVEPPLSELRHLAAGQRLGLIRRVVEHLDLEQVARIVEARHRIEEALDHRRLVE